MTIYIYSGPPSGATLNEGGKQREVLLWPGKTVELTPDHPYTLTLLALRHLQETDKTTPSTLSVSSRKNKSRSPVEVNNVG